MGKDYAVNKRRKRAAPRKRSRNQASIPSWIWLVTGLVLGLVMALVIYVRLHGSEIMGDRVKKALNHTITTAKAVRHIPTTPKPLTDQTHYDFYTMLPKMDIDAGNNNDTNTSAAKTKVNKTVAQANDDADDDDDTSTTNNNVKTEIASKKKTSENTKLATKSSATSTSISANVNSQQSARPLVKVETAKPVIPPAPSTYYLHVASFPDFDEADNLKAQLIISGFTVKVKTKMIKGKQINIVYVGPYASKDAALQGQASLSSNNIKSVMVKAIA